MKPDNYSTHHGIRIYQNYPDPGRGGHKMPIVCVHGMWGFALVFRFWFALAEMFGIKMYAIELRGHNKSLQCFGLDKLSMTTHVSDVDDIIRTEIGDCVLMGWSMGGLISQRVAAQNSRVKKLVLVTSGSPPGILLRGKILLKMIKPRYIWAMVTGRVFRIAKKDAIDLMSNAGFSEQERLEFVEELNPESGKVAQEMTLDQFAFWKNSDIKLRCPVLVVSAQHDAITPVSLQQAIRRRYDAHYIEIPGASHAVMLQPGVRELAFTQIIRWVYGESATHTQPA